jgi:hypothetical protein
MFTTIEKQIVEIYEKYCETFFKNTWSSEIYSIKCVCIKTCLLPKKITDTIHDWKFKVLLDGKALNVGTTWDGLLYSNKFYRSNNESRSNELRFFVEDSTLKKIQFIAYKFQETPEKKPETQMDIILKELKEMKKDIELLNQKVDDCI